MGASFSHVPGALSLSLHTTLYFQCRNAIIFSFVCYFVLCLFVFFLSFWWAFSSNFPPIFHLHLPFSLSRLPLSSFDSFPFYPTLPHLFSLWFVLFSAVNSCSSFMRNLVRFVVYVTSTPFPSHFLGDSVFALEYLFTQDFFSQYGSHVNYFSVFLLLHFWLWI